MNGSLARRMRRTLAATIAIGLITVTLLGALAAYMTEVRTLSQDASYVLREIPPLLTDPASRSSPRTALKTVMTHLYHPGLVVRMSVDNAGYLGRWTNEPPHYEIATDPQAGIPFAAQSMPPLAHVAFYVARLLGYSGVATLVDEMTVVVEADNRVLNADFSRVLAIAAILGVLSTLLALFVARRLTERALAPLSTVLGALESFASGDLTPRLVKTNLAARDDELGRLVVAYNGAIETVDRALAERARSEAQMRQFIADASHQLQTPLTVLRGFIGILRRNDVHAQEDIPRILATMDRQSAIMAELIKKLMLLESWETDRETEPDVLDVGAVVEDVAHSIAAAHPDREIQVTAGATMMARVSGSELTYAVSNLIDNALKYAPDGPITVTIQGDAKLVYATVADRGAGMTREEIDRIFDRFYRGARRDVPGSGLGLAIAKRAVERANGTLTVDSTVGQGSRFTIVLPRVSV